MENTTFGMWSSHKEGQFTMNHNAAKYLQDNGMIPLHYSEPNGKSTMAYPYNPNGSVDGIAAIQSIDGRHMAIMPHPERSFLKWQTPWLSTTNSKQLCDTDYTPWFSMFKNAVDWVKSNKAILVLGSGAREHTIVEKLTESSTVTKVYISPGNDGMVHNRDYCVE